MADRQTDEEFRAAFVAYMVAKGVDLALANECADNAMPMRQDFPDDDGATSAASEMSYWDEPEDTTHD
jgi:hypothetical protein